MISLFETHCHLNHERFRNDYVEVLARARQSGVSELLIVGYDLDSSRRAVELACPEEGLYAAVGVHPHDAGSWSAGIEAELRALAQRPGMVAIGEIGLDFYRDLSPRDAQQAAFRAQLDLAAELQQPVVVHTRESVTPALEVLEPYARRGLQGVMHCWSGTAAEARRARSFGLLLGIGGVLTYPHPDALPEVVAESPVEALLLETDSPYLPPVPFRGRRNEPAYLALIAAKLAGMKGLEVTELAALTRAAAAKLFGVFRPGS